MMKRLMLVLSGVLAGVAFTLSCDKGPAPSPAQEAAGPMKVLTADTDINQLAVGKASAPDAVVVTGPFVLTDLTLVGAGMIIGAGTTCPVAAASATFSGTGAPTAVRIPVPAGSVACAFITGSGE